MGQPRWAGRVRSAVVSVAIVATAASGCATSGGNRPVDSVTVSSSQFRDGAPLPKEYACGGVGNPPLRWSNIPSTAKSIALVVDSSSPNGSAVHWVVYNIDFRTTVLIESGVPQGARQGRVTSGKVGYDPPCQDGVSYRFSVYALDSRLDLQEGAYLTETLPAIANHTIARGRITATGIE
jgi:Raf kinase inhibitor-like YbhB/YbcL family protein